MAIEVSKGTRRGRRTGVRSRDGIGVDRLQGDKNTDDAKVHDQQVAARLDAIEEIQGRILDQLSLITEISLAPGERLDQ